jgi:cation diffusion facilitator family transporter
MVVEEARARCAPEAERFLAVRRSGRISIAVNCVLTLLQFAVGVAANAQSLIADAAHTLSDMLGDALVLWANRRGSDPADAAHPYGHRRIETVASLLLGAGLLVTGLGILWAAVERMLHVGALPPIGVLALAMALATLAAKEVLFRYVLRVASRTRSPMLVASAWHARSDAASSLVVAVGIGGALLGYRYLDPLAAALVAFLIVRMGVKFGYEALQELIDTGLNEKELGSIRATLLDTPGVLGLHEVRTRRMAHRALVDAHVRVDARISVSEGHRIGDEARLRVLRDHPEVLDVLVHVDAEEDQPAAGAATGLPGRETLLRHLRALLGEDAPELEKALLHYLGNRVEAELFLPWDACRDATRVAALERRIAERLPADPFFSAISLNCRVAPK